MIDLPNTVCVHHRLTALQICGSSEPKGEAYPSTLDAAVSYTLTSGLLSEKDFNDGRECALGQIALRMLLVTSGGARNY
eukprot:2452225-Amphidinium_carterae.1